MADIQQMVDFKHIFQQWNKGEEEQDLGYDTEFGIWIWPQLKKRPKPAGPVSIPWS